MISCQFIGGLGNQMFQIASTYALALDNNDECAFNFNAPPAGQGNSPWHYRSNIYKKLNELPASWRPSFKYKEPSYAYSPIPYKENMLLSGYLGHEKYFSHHREAVVRLFKDDNCIRRTDKRYNHILKNSVSIHVRRGDYLKYPDVYILPSADYYYRALSYIDSKVHIDNILIVSDDIEWCKENLKDERITYICGEFDYIDFYLMTMCDHQILANSSFSWWGNYLNEKENSIAISPKQWFVKGCGAYDEYLIRKNWITI